MIQQQLTKCPTASLFKQLLSMMYDAFLVIALLFLATAILLPFTGGEAINGIYYNLYLIIVVFVFFTWFWSKSGQTLGMKVWKIKLIDEFGFNPSWQICVLRLMFATLSLLLLGIGYWWKLFSGQTLHGKLSQTRLIDEKKCEKLNQNND